VPSIGKSTVTRQADGPPGETLGWGSAVCGKYRRKRRGNGGGNGQHSTRGALERSGKHRSVSQRARRPGLRVEDDSRRASKDPWRCVGTEELFGKRAPERRV